MLKQGEFGKAQQELFGATGLEFHGGLGVQSRAFYLQHDAFAESAVLYLIALFQGLIVR